jgi:hypothetical protein
MNNDDTAKKLLADSYVQSAARIRDAIQGQLTIQNSREPNTPPAIAGEVVGLCGQGGRHAYFRIPINVLEATLDRITRASVSGALATSSIEHVTEEIAAACQDLRQQTYFDTGTRCVNDSLPSMVPLLPPEEIWLDGRELPMDVWRLVCFEFDLVSSAVSSQVSVRDFAFSAVNQNALAFRYLVNQLGNRRVTFGVKLDRVPSAWSSSVAFTKDVSLARVFFEAGSLLTPLAKDDFIRGYGAIRYSHWIDGGSPELRVKDEFKEESVDSRYRGLFAEETAVGLMAIVLADVFGAKPINNTAELMKVKHGQPVADFIAQTTNPSTSQKTTIIAESKGSLGRPIKEDRMNHAKEQVGETKFMYPGSVGPLLLAFGSRVSFSNQTEGTRCLVADPDPNFDSESVYISPIDAWREAFAKAFKFVGLEMAAQQILRGGPAALRPIDFDRELDRTRNERDLQRLRRARSARQRFGMELLLDVGSQAVSLDSDVLAILRRGIDGESAQKLSEILDSRRQLARERSREASFEGSLGLGCVSYSDLDEQSDQDRTPQM